MSFIIDSIRFLLDPFNILWLLGLIMVILWSLDKKKLLKSFVVFTVVFFFFVSTPLVPVLLVNSLEDSYQPLDTEIFLSDNVKDIHIVVLGGGHGFDERLPANSLLSLQALSRLNEGIRLHIKLPSSKLVLSGYSASGRTSQAEMLQNTALLLGVEKDATIIQSEPGNTYEEAEVYARNFGNKQSVILVTSALHMPRAMMMFEKHGIEPLASPTHYRLKGSRKHKRLGLPSMSNMDHFSKSISEYVAMLRYLNLSD